MAVTKTEFQVNSGNPGWTAQQVLDTLESALGPSGAGHHSGTAVSGAIRKILKPTDGWDEVGGVQSIGTQTTPDRTFNSNFDDTGTYWDEWDYTDPSPPSGGTACIITVRRHGSAWNSSTQGKVECVFIRNEGSGYTNGYSLTIPKASIGGTDPNNADITFGTNSATVPEIKIYTTRGGTSNWWWKDTDIGSNTSGFASALKTGVCRVTNDASKTYGTTYYSFTVQAPTASNKHGIIYIKSGPKFDIYRQAHNLGNKITNYQGGFYGDECMDHFGCTPSSNAMSVPSTGNSWNSVSSNYAYAASFPCVTSIDYTSDGISSTGTTYGVSLSQAFSRSTTATDYPLKIVTYKGSQSQDPNYCVIQFQQVVAGDVETILSFSLNKGNQWGQNIWDLDDVFQGGLTFYKDSERTTIGGTEISSANSDYYGNSIYIHTQDTVTLKGSSYYNSNLPNHYGSSYINAGTRMRESLYGYDKTSMNSTTTKYAQTGDHYITNFDGASNTEGTTDGPETSILYQYYRNDTYDKCIVGGVTKSVNANANYHKPIKGLPINSSWFPCPYYLPDDFVMIQLAVTPGATVVRSGDTITVSGSEVYTVIEASGSVNYELFDNDNVTVAKYICFCARTT